MKPVLQKKLKRKKNPPSFFKMCLETLFTIFSALMIALVLRTFAIEPFKIPSGSMLPNLLIGDFLFVSKYSYGYSRFSFPLGIDYFDGRIMSSNPKRGDIVVFRNPKREQINFVKRVVGLPGDTVQVIDGILFINNEPMRRTEITLPDYVRNTGFARAYSEGFSNGTHHDILETSGDRGFADNTPLYKVPEGNFFMMGDNRDNSSDSRFLSDLGYVPLDYIVGRVEFIFFSHDFSNGYRIRWPRIFSAVQ